MEVKKGIKIACVDIFSPSFEQEANFEEGKKEEGGGRGITRTITRLETLVLKPGYNIKCFFSLF